MLSVLLESPEKLIFNKIGQPKPESGEVLIRIRRVGICGSDIHAYYGKHPTIFLPVIQGHEFSGEIAALGDGVNGFQVGEAVTVRPQYTCGECYYCKHGHENVCKKLKVIGCQVPGAAQEYLAVKSNLVYKLPKDMSYDDGAMVEPVAVAVAAVKSFSHDVKGKNILVLGAGTIGNLIAQMAKALGAASVTITDLCEEKLQIAKKCGIDHRVNTKEENLEKALMEFYGEDNLDAALECVGVEATVNEAIKVCRKGSEIIIVGIYSKRPAIDMINVQEKELKLTGTLMYLEDDYYTAIRLIEDGKINLEALKTAHFPLNQFDRAYKFIEQNKTTAMKVLIDVTD